jgi:hypothetical protein
MQKHIVDDGLKMGGGEGDPAIIKSVISGVINAGMELRRTN